MFAGDETYGDEVTSPFEILSRIDAILDENDDVVLCFHGCVDECEDPTAGFLYPTR